MLRFEAVAFQTGTFRLDAELSLGARRRIAIMGPSGAGKSTLVNGVAGFQDLAAGRITWHGQDLTGLSPGQRPIAMLFQDGNLFPHLSVRDNVRLGVRPNLKLLEEERHRVDVALDRVGLSDFHGRRPAELSGGQQSRAALARVLVQAKPILILDEPFAALGPALKADMLDLVVELTEDSEALVLMVTHDPDDARRIADELVLVTDGRAHPPADVTITLNDPPPALKAYLGTA